MTNDTLRLSPSHRRLRRLDRIGTDLSQALAEAIKVATGAGPRGRDAAIHEARDEMAPKLMGVVSYNAVFRKRPWIFVTAPGSMTYGFRGQDLLAVCARVHALGRPVLLIRPDDVFHLALYFDKRIKRPLYDELPENLQLALTRLYLTEHDSAASSEDRSRGDRNPITTDGSRAPRGALGAVMRGDVS